MLRFLTGDDRVPLRPLPPESRPLGSVVERALRRDPNARFQSAAVMRDALDHPPQPR